MRDFKNKKRELLTIKRDLLDNIERALGEMEAAECFFQNTTDPKLIEVAIYYKHATLTRYEYLLKQAKELSISINAQDLLDRNSVRAVI